jgi:hypothetical protein
LELLPDVGFFSMWGESTINSTQDEGFILECKAFLYQIEAEYLPVKMCLSGYEGLMPESALTLKDFIMAYA